MNKIITGKSKNTKFLDLMINDIFFSGNLLNKNAPEAKPFYSIFDRKLKHNLKKIKDQRCLGLIKAYVSGNEKIDTQFKVLREQGNLKARLIKNYDRNDELIIINTAGGLTSGDLNINLIKVYEDVNLNISTQSMEKIYKCKDFSAYSYTNIIVGANSYVSWMPLETIFFNEAKLRRRINIDLDTKSNFLGIETIIFGRKAMGEIVQKGTLDDAWQIYKNGKLVYSDFNRIYGNIQKKLSNALVMKGNNILCNIVFTGKKIKSYKRKILIYLHKKKYFAGVSLVNGVLLIKMLAKDISEIRMFIDKLMNIFDDNFNSPKIWNF